MVSLRRFTVLVVSVRAGILFCQEVIPRDVPDGKPRSLRIAPRRSDSLSHSRWTPYGPNRSLDTEREVAEGFQDAALARSAVTLTHNALVVDMTARR
jgi:hypothetical protein